MNWIDVVATIMFVAFVTFLVAKAIDDHRQHKEYIAHLDRRTQALGDDVLRLLRSEPAEREQGVEGQRGVQGQTGVGGDYTIIENEDD